MLPGAVSSFRMLVAAGFVAGIALLFSGPRAAAQPAITIDSSVADRGERAANRARCAAPPAICSTTSKRCFGKKPKLVNTLDEAGPMAIVIAERSHVPRGREVRDNHRYRVVRVFSRRAAERREFAHAPCALAGADMRGTIYAIYQFSQTYLGVDPMYLWTDKQPEKRSSITLPADFAHAIPARCSSIAASFPTMKTC